MKDIEKELFPDSGILKIEGGIATAQLVDEELDCFEVTLNNDSCVQIDTEGFSWITLSRENIMDLIRLIDEADEFYKTKKADN